MSKRARTDRRTFLEHSGRLLAGSFVLPLLPAEARALRPAQSGGRDGQQADTLVVIYQRGGADALNIVVPWTNQQYYAVRPTIAVPAEAREGRPGVVKLTDDHGLHPALASLKPWWDQGRMAAMLSAGSPHPTRSHFDAQDFMEYAAPGDRTLKQGWLNRYLAATHKSANQPRIRALAMQGLLPRSLRGRHAVLAVPRLTRQRSEGMLDLFDDVYGDSGGMEGGAMGVASGREAVVEVGRSTIEVLRRFWDITERTPGPGKGVKYPRHGFGNRLMTLAKLIKAGCGLEVAALDLPSWDHHQGEGSTNGLIARRLKLLADGLAAFGADLGPRMKRVTVLVMTEFGRNVAENGNRGTDHGRGSVMLALGGHLKQSRVVGTYGSLKPKNLYDGRDLNVDIDFRQVFAETLQGVLGFTPPAGFFPRWKPGHPIDVMAR